MGAHLTPNEGVIINTFHSDGLQNHIIMDAGISCLEFFDLPVTQYSPHPNLCLIPLASWLP